MLLNHASIAVKFLPQTNTQKTNIALKPAQTEPNRDCRNYAIIKNVRYIGKENVYNMEVKNRHNFSVNGGLIVHNCIDATRYALEDVGKMVFAYA